MEDKDSFRKVSLHSLNLVYSLCLVIRMSLSFGYKEVTFLLGSLRLAWQMEGERKPLSKSAISQLASAQDDRYFILVYY